MYNWLTSHSMTEPRHATHGYAEVLETACNKTHKKTSNLLSFVKNSISNDLNRLLVVPKNMRVEERGSFVWLLMSLTQLWLSLKLMEDVSGAVTTLFGSAAAACFLLFIVVFRKEQRELLMNPMLLKKEVHDDQITKQNRGVWGVIILWVISIVIGSFVLP